MSRRRRIARVRPRRSGRRRRAISSAVGAAALTALVVLVAPSATSASPPAAAPPSACDPAAVVRTGATWRLRPTGVDDTVNLQCAGDEAAATGRSARIVLGEGTFRIGFVAIDGFLGLVRGAGRGKTSIEPVPALDCASRFAATGSVDLLAFADSELRVRDLSMSASVAPVCAEPWLERPAELFGPGFPAIARSDLETLLAVRPVLGRTCDELMTVSDLTVSNVGFRGADPDFTAPVFAPGSVQHAVMFGQGIVTLDSPEPPCLGPTMTGRLTVTRSEFDELGIAIDASNLVDSTVRIHANRFHVGLGFLSRDNFGSRVTVSGNEIVGPPGGPPILNPLGVLVLSSCDGPNPRAALTKLRVRTNDISQSAFGSGVVAVDCANGFGGLRTLDTVIADNHIDLADAVAAVQIVFGADGRVTGNEVRGTATAGIGLLTQPGAAPTSGYRVAGNDLDDLEASNADVFLAPGTTGNVVIVDDGDTVDDQGTDNDVIVR